MNSLALAGLVIVALNPTELFRAGTQLSFLAVAGLIALGPLARRHEPPRSARAIDRPEPAVANANVAPREARAVSSGICRADHLAGHRAAGHGPFSFGFAGRDSAHAGARVADDAGDDLGVRRVAVRRLAAAGDEAVCDFVRSKSGALGMGRGEDGLLEMEPSVGRGTARLVAMRDLFDLGRDHLHPRHLAVGSRAHRHRR